jgi:hypothetical protein
LRKEKWRKEYPIATEVYLSLIQQGYSKAAACGIIGNMMAEVGGHTLNLEYNTYTDGYYGLCQWSLNYCSNVYGLDTNGQINYLFKTIEQSFKSYGSNFYNFLRITNPAEAAIIFAKAYERCDSASYGQRGINAIIAFDYFT